MNIAENEQAMLRRSQEIFEADQKLLETLLDIFNQYDMTKALREGRLVPERAAEWFQSGGFAMKRAIREYISTQAFPDQFELLSDKYIQTIFITGLRQISNHNRSKRQNSDQ